MEQKILSKSPMVSRLPKFGARPVNGSPAPIPNGLTQTSPIQEVKSPPAKPNGLVRATSKWRKESDGTADPTTDEVCPSKEKKDIHSQPSLGNRELKSPSTCSTKLQSSASSFSTGSPKSPKLIPSPKSKPKSTPITTIANTQDITPKISGSKPISNGVLPVGSAAGRTVSSGLQRPRAYSGSHANGSREGLSHSNDSLSRQSIVPDHMVRSQSFTHFKQLPSPTNAPMIRSFSFNKSVELAKPLANTQLQPPRTFGFKSSHSLSKGRFTLGLGGLGLKKGLSDQTNEIRPADILTPLDVIKRPLLSNSILTKPSLQAGRLNRPTAAKSQYPPVVGRTPVENDVITPPLTPEQPQCAIKSAPDSPEEALKEQGQDGNLRCAGECSEDMSLSSASSLDRNDNSEEFLDDFDNLGDPSQNSITLNNSSGDKSTRMRLQSFLNETLGWTGMGLGGGKADLRTGSSPDIECPATSSLEVSPSNSSGGTYMWDEEGLEPLGHGTHLHHCTSFESDLNSIDILNNLDNTGSCDLEDDDLMLDIDLQEDVSLRSDRMAHLERSERGGRPAQWRRRQHRWSGTDHSQNDNRLHYDGSRSTHRPLHPAIHSDGHTAVLDELVLKHMADDFTSVKSQLLKLQSLLQMDEGDITTEILDTSEDDTKAKQMEEMMKEVADLREELKKKDKIITQLMHQRQQESVNLISKSVGSRVREEHIMINPLRRHGGRPIITTLVHPILSSLPGSASTRLHLVPACLNVDKPPILQPINHIPNDTLIQGRVASSAPTGDRSDSEKRYLAPCTSIVPSPPRKSGVLHKESKSLPDPEELSLLLSTHLRIQDNHESESRQNGEHRARPTPHIQHNKVQRASSSFFSPRVLQGPRLHRRVTLSALPQAGGSEVNPKHSPIAMNAKQLPPPSRGLPCISSGNHVGTLGMMSDTWPLVAGRETVPNLGDGSVSKPGSMMNLGAKQLPSPSQSLQYVSSGNRSETLSHVK